MKDFLVYCWQEKRERQKNVFGEILFQNNTNGTTGVQIIVNEKPGKRRSWSFHRLTRFYIEPFMNVYQMYKVYILKTRAE